MRHYATISMLVFSVLVAICAVPQAAASNAALDTAAIDRFVLAQMAANRIPGLALAVTHAGQVVYTHGYGMARDGEAVTDQTQFRLASLSKSFTATAVLQLVEAGKINLDMPITHYLPDFALAEPGAAARITVRQLLNHTSGLGDLGFTQGLTRQQTTLADRVASLRTARPIAAPGTSFQYFDPNYQILARLVEMVSGQPFDAYLQMHIFTPLDMRATVSALTSDAATARAERLAQGHVVVYGTPVAASELSGFLGGSGGVVSTAADMARYLIAHSNGGQSAGRRILSAASVRLMQTPPHGIASSYGMGWLVGEAQGTRTLEHNGVLSTCYAEAVLLPDSGYSFVLLYNAYSLASSASAFPTIKNGIVALLTNQEPASPRLTVPILGYILLALTVLGTWLALRSLLRLPRWVAQASTRPRWRALPGIVWAFIPGVLLLGLPQLLAQSTGRFFTYTMLARAMPDIIIWLGICGSLGILNGVARLIVLVRSHPQHRR